jgi:dipeptidyl aminopeptidase/acylaminoacyl peptidase
MGIKNHAKKIAATTGIVVAALAFPTAGVASAAPKTVTAQADLDGNGTLDSLSLSQASSTSQVLEATIGGRVVRATLPSDDFTGVQPMQVTDMNADGKAEVVVTEYWGANTVTMSAWDFDGRGLRVLSTVDGEPLRLYEGGGISARSGYTCETSRRGKVLVSFSAVWDDDSRDGVTYSGTRTSYLVRDGVATPSARFSFTGVGQSSAWVNGNPAACA